ncbi:MAG: ATP-binding protein [Rhodoblastus sp.]
MQCYVPEVNAQAEFLEICNDFTEPREIVREAISNGFDAGAKNVTISAHVDRTTGVDELVLRFHDDGHGMDEPSLKAFFSLAKTTRMQTDERGFKMSGAIGEKGHGTKIYFNSRKITVNTVKDGTMIEAVMENPRAKLRRGEMPVVEFFSRSVDAPNSTTIIVNGYNDNSLGGFGHEALKDYILWFTKFGSCEILVGKTTFQDVVLKLLGLGWTSNDPEQISFGHRFPEEKSDLTSLRKSDKISPLDYFVARWVFPDVPVDDKPGSKIDIVFSLEGDQAKRISNPMLHEKWRSWREGEYNVEDRYGLWLCKDFIPVARKNNWVAERSEWTKYHAFVNSQDLRLTANRSNIDNTPSRDLAAIQKTVERVFKERIRLDRKFQSYQDELEKQQMYKNAEAEEKDFLRRKKEASSKKAATYKGLTLLEPRQEGGVFSIVMQLLAVEPGLFGFSVVDYDTAFGYDLLVTTDTALELNRAALRFVEMKFQLQRDFNHSFRKLSAVICWDTKLANEDAVEDMTGAKRKMKITSPKVDKSLRYQKYMLVSDTESHNIEVFVLKEFLSEHLSCEFRPRSQ